MYYHQIRSPLSDQLPFEYYYQRMYSLLQCQYYPDRLQLLTNLLKSHCPQPVSQPAPQPKINYNGLQEELMNVFIHMISKHFEDDKLTSMLNNIKKCLSEDLTVHVEEKDGQTKRTVSPTIPIVPPVSQPAPIPSVQTFTFTNDDCKNLTNNLVDLINKNTSPSNKAVVDTFTNLFTTFLNLDKKEDLDKKEKDLADQVLDEFLKTQ